MRITKTRCLLGALLLASQISAQRKVATLAISGENNLRYAYTLPDDYDPHKAYPVLIAPGMGRDDTTVNLFFGPRPEQHGWILIESVALIRGAKVMQALLDELKRNYTIEGFHFLGYSANSAGEFDIAMELASEFTSVTGLPGHPRTTDSKKLQRLKSLKIQFIVGENDSWWKKQALNSQKTLESLGVDVRLQIVKDGGHILRHYAGAPLFKILNTLR
ncbi:hypothetical protein WIW50_14925 [Flavobacteriaceae bacterium 3-367]